MINVKTANAIGLTISGAFLLLADEVLACFGHKRERRLRRRRASHPASRPQ
jgi:hypothetical protein